MSTTEVLTAILINHLPDFGFHCILYFNHLNDIIYVAHQVYNRFCYNVVTSEILIIFFLLGVAFYRGADCCVLVFDVTQPNTFKV